MVLTFIVVGAAIGTPAVSVPARLQGSARIASVATASPAIAAAADPASLVLKPDEPGVVSVTVGFSVTITLRAQSVFTRTWVRPAVEGSGFTISNQGVVVTASSLLVPDPTADRIYGANLIFGFAEKLDLLPNALRQRVNGPSNTELQQCYDESSHRCSVTSSPVVQVFPFLDPPGRPLAAKLLTSTHGVAVVSTSIGSRTMPSTPLSSNTALPSHLTALGFAEGVRAGIWPTIVTATPTRPSTATGSPMLTASSTTEHPDHLVGGPVFDPTTGEAVGLLGTLSDTRRGYSFVSVADIGAALASAGEKPSYGDVVDSSYRDALGHLQDGAGHYADARGALVPVEKAWPGQAPATRYLSALSLIVAAGPSATSMTPAHTAGDGSGVRHNLGLLALAFAVGVVLTLGGAFLIGRRHKAAPRVSESPPVPPDALDPGPSPSAAPSQVIRPNSNPIVPTTSSSTAVAEASGERNLTKIRSTPADRERDNQGLTRIRRSPILAGEEAGQYQFCPSCGQPVVAGHRYCPRCGHATSDKG